MSAHTGKVVELLNFSVHEDSQNYVIIESVTSSINKTMHVCNFDAKTLIKIGRGQQADIRISDISVSRFHSSFFLCRDGSLAIVDNASKFGTLKLIRHPLQISAKTFEPVFVQVGRAMLCLKVQKQEKPLIQKLCDCLRGRPPKVE